MPSYSHNHKCHFLPQAPVSAVENDKELGVITYISALGNGTGGLRVQGQLLIHSELV